ncbi:MAG: hypothetical protein DWQ34_07205 [Planctomycetota bacterium]|nr:MAG: hypothetical protein DWQ29_16750 [Planctomycetota bacterium]REJ94990.1 MAG: hypothetical protein DWQ34_07205 [Planctomycetota bacterium]REK23441.1 MAG: hypothetical protein DWQ41_16965 [Planctomycetota bacterium]REK38919.1 MAG: hypothetical protein DWQ45_03490 [Planctomycetota bacterium]
MDLMMADISSLATARVRFVLAVLALNVVTDAGPVGAQDSGDVLNDGATIQRRRIDNFINRTAKMSFEDAVASLSTYTEGYELAGLASISHGSANPRVMLVQIFADRRVAKLHEILAEQDADDAAQRVEAIFTEKLETFVEETERFRADEHEQPLQYMSAYHLYAASVALFLCANFCDKPTFLELLDKWHAAFPDDSRQGSGIFISALPDALLELNLLLLVYEKEGASRDELNQRLTSVGKDYGVEDWTAETLRLYRWNSHTNDTDFTHITQGARADDAAILARVPGFRDWPPISGFVHKPEVQDRVIGRVRSWVE